MPAPAVAAGAIVSIAPNPVDLGSVPSGSIGPSQTVTITNNGPGAVSFTGGQSVGANLVYRFGTCPPNTGTLAEGASCTVRVRAAPTSTGTVTSQTVFLSSDAASPGIRIATTFTGTAALPAPTLIEYPVPPAGTTNANVSGLTRAGDGNLWFADDANDRLGRITPSGTFTLFALAAHSNPLGITQDSAGQLAYWQDGTCCNGLKGLAFSSTSGVQTSFTAVGSPNFGDLALGADGAIYETDQGFGVYRIAGGAATRNPLPQGTTTDLSGIAAGPDGRLWAANFNPQQLAAMTTAGVFQMFSTAPLAPTSVVAGPDAALWFNGERTAQIGRMTTAGVMTTYDVSFAQARGMAFDLAGHLWFGDINHSGRIVELDPTTGIETVHAVTSRAFYPVLAPDGNIWFLDKTSPQPRIAELDLGVPPSATLAPTQADFGDVTVGQVSATKEFTLTNNGPNELSVSGVTVSDPSQFTATVVGGTAACRRLATGSGCTVDVTATPQNLGVQNATLKVASNATGSPHTAALKVTGAAPPVRSITVSPGGISCAPLIIIPNGSCATGTVTVTNGAVAGHVDVTGAGATPSDGGSPWALCGGAGSPACRGPGGAPGPDQFATTLGSLNLGITAGPDTAFGIAGAAAAQQSVQETASTVGPSATTDPSPTFTSSITWTAVP